MTGQWSPRFVPVGVLLLVLAGCGQPAPIDVQELTDRPKGFVGSETCKVCHLEHYDSWRMTLHSRMLQDAKQNEDAIVVQLDITEIRNDLSKPSKNLKVPLDKVYIPAGADILYTIGGQWRQQYLVKMNGTLVIAPIQYSVDSHDWSPYQEEEWDKRPWILECGGCHATGVDIEKQTFKEPGVGCEACHGKGSWHAALPKSAVFQKRQTIVNPAKLTMGVAVQICGSCHTRGISTKVKGAEWPVGYEPGKALAAYFKSPSFPTEGDVKKVYAGEFSKGHHQQYLDWTQSQHFKEGVTCTSCHYVHQMGVPPTRSQTKSAGSRQCFECHPLVNSKLAHSIHSFGNCIGCHMPRIAVSQESGVTRSHVFTPLLPKDSLANPGVPNSCQSCHEHKNADLQILQIKYEQSAGKD